MNFYKFWQRLNRKDSFDKELLPLELFSHLTHISGIATSGLPRAEIFALAANLPYHSAVYFKKVHFLVRELNYDYAKACRVVGEITEEPEPKELLLHLSSSLLAGESEASFMAREAYVMGEAYGDRYERQVESLRKWTDGYMALVLSAAVILTISMVCTIIYPMSSSIIIILSAVALLASSIGAWILYRASPKDIKTPSTVDTSKEQKLAKSLFKICWPAVGIACPLLALLGLDLGWIMITAAVLILPPGLIIILDDKRIDKQDNDIAAFLRSLGSVTKAIGATVTEALGNLNYRSYGSMQSGVERLHVRLRGGGISPELCWSRFISETGSELVKRSTEIFWDSVIAGGDPEVVGKASSMFAMKIAFLRAKKTLVSQSFTWLCITMHAVLVALMVFIYQIMIIFSGAFQTLEVDETSGDLANMPFAELFSGAQLNLLHSVTIALILVLSGANAFAIKATEGGHNYKFIYYLSIMLAVAGAVLVSVPPIASAIFSSMPMLE